jgi:hypothetical protein
MAIVTGCDAIRGSGSLDLIKLDLPVLMPRIGVPGLQIPSTATAAIIVRPVGGHVNKILFTDNTLYHKPQFFGNRIAERLSDQLTRILNRKLDL